MKTLTTTDTYRVRAVLDGRGIEHEFSDRTEAQHAYERLRRQIEGGATGCVGLSVNGFLSSHHASQGYPWPWG